MLCGLTSESEMIRTDKKYGRGKRERGLLTDKVNTAENIQGYQLKPSASLERPSFIC